LPNRGGSDSVALIASINGPSFGGFASISTLTVSFWSGALHTRPMDATSVRPPRAQAAHQEASHLVKQLPRRLRGEPLKPYVYRDFGSLVSLGRSTVGNLMGFLVGKNFFIEGYFARLMYRSLYKMHEAALHGLANVILGAIGRASTPRFGNLRSRYMTAFRRSEKVFRGIVHCQSRGVIQSKLLSPAAPRRSLPGQLDFDPIGRDGDPIDNFPDKAF
jgi:hypothetical protein